MDAHQRFVMAGDMLVGARSGDGATEPPLRSMISDFEASIGAACKDAGEELQIKVAEVATVLYASSVDYKP